MLSSLGTDPSEISNTLLTRYALKPESLSAVERQKIRAQINDALVMQERYARLRENAKLFFGVETTLADV